MTTPNTPNAAERPSDRAIAQAYYEACALGAENYLPSIEARASEIDSHHPAESVSAEPVDVVCKGWLAALSDAYHDLCNHEFPSASKISDIHTFLATHPVYLHPQPSTPGAVSDEDLRQWRFALERAIESQRLLAEGIDKDNPDDPWASLMVWEDVTQLGNLATALESFAKRGAAATEDGDVARITEDALIGMTMLRAGTPTMFVVSMAQLAAREYAKRSAAPPAQAVSVPEVPDGYELVPSSALRWLFGKEGDFECPASEYFHGNPAPFWWRREFRRRIYAAPAAATREGKE